MGEKVYDTMIPRNVRVSEAPSLRQAGAALRSQVRRQPSLSAARDRDHPARARSCARAQLSESAGMSMAQEAAMADDAARRGSAADLRR